MPTTKQVKFSGEEEKVDDPSQTEKATIQILKKKLQKADKALSLRAPAPKASDSLAKMINLVATKVSAKYFRTSASIRALKKMVDEMGVNTAANKTRPLIVATLKACCTRGLDFNVLELGIPTLSDEEMGAIYTKPSFSADPPKED